MRPFLLFVVESNSVAMTDWIYIHSVLDFHYGRNGYRAKPIYAGSKTRLIEQRKIEIERAKVKGQSSVIVVADVDNGDHDLNALIEATCKKEGYDIVWMNADIEDVFLGEKVEKKSKRRKAIAFQRIKDEKLKALAEGKLQERDPLKKAHSSNLLLVLDKHLKRLKKAS